VIECAFKTVAVLGNREHIDSGRASSVYAPTVSPPAQRWLLVEAAASGWNIEQFDISNAVAQASIVDEEVLMTLPKRWSKDPKGERVRLLKNLDGLKCAPRSGLISTPRPGENKAGRRMSANLEFFARQLMEKR